MISSADTSRGVQVVTADSGWDKLLGFFPKQKEALDALYSSRFVLYGGARGGGKSRWLRWSAADYLVAMHQDLGLRDVHVGLFCETYPDLRDRQVGKISIEFPEWLGKLADTKENGLSFKLHESFGSGVIALRNLDDPSKYQSAEFAAEFIDELTKTTVETFNILRGSLRWPGVSHTVFAGGTNPGGVGHAWVKSYWIDGVFPIEMRALAPQFKFIQSLPSDNPTLDATYWADLNSLPPNLRRAWVEGDWTVFSGMAFPGWSADHIIPDFDIPAYWPRTIGIDWGYSKPFAAVWIATNPDNGRRYIYRELYAPELTDQQQARLIASHCEGEQIRARYADPAMWTKRTQQSVITSTADVYSQNGVHLLPGDNDRVGGKRKVDRLLMALPDGMPGIQVFRSCVNWIRTFPTLVYDKYQVEDVDSSQDDHLFDATKYGLTDYRPQVENKLFDVPTRKHPMFKMKDRGLF
jgi:hypothetical protein